MFIIDFVVIVSVGYLAFYVAYIFLLYLAHFFVRKHGDPFDEQPSIRFAILIPAHNEQLLIKYLLDSIKELDYPREKVTAYVIADNCTDATAKIATECGMVALERFNKAEAGKGQALSWALTKIDRETYDACLVIDADGLIDRAALLYLDAAIKNGKEIIQCRNDISNPDCNWFTRLQDVSRTIWNEIYLPTKASFGFTSPLVGNGMCFSKRILTDYGWDSFSVGEDWEYYAKIILGGEKVSFAYKARVYQRESSSLKQATPQRMRWSGGRFAIAWKYGTRLFYEGISERNLLKFEASFSLVFPNPSMGININMLLLFAAVIFPIHLKGFFVALLAVFALIQLLIFVSGVAYTKDRLKKLGAIVIAPLFLVWKMGIDVISIFGAGRKKWVRTERKL